MLSCTLPWHGKTVLWFIENYTKHTSPADTITLSMNGCITSIDAVHTPCESNCKCV